MTRIAALALGVLLVATSCGDPEVGGRPPPTTIRPAGSAEPSTTTVAPSTASPTTRPTAPTVAQPTTTLAQPPTTEAPLPVETMSLKVYFFMDGGEDFRPGPFLVPVHREVGTTPGVGKAAIGELLAGPTAAEAEALPGLSTSVPAGTALLGIAVENGLATVDLSRQFESGGGSASMLGRLAQVVYTLTQFPTVDEVEFRLDGEDVTVFSGEGILLEGPVSRQDYVDFLPSIFVDGPSYGGLLGNPARIEGTAAVYEATFHLAILDGDGRTLAEPPYVMTNEGLGWDLHWGRFDVTIPYVVDEPQVGSLLVWDVSAEDGTRQNLREYLVWLTP